MYDGVISGQKRLLPILDTGYFNVGKSLKGGEYHIVLIDGMYSYKSNVVELSIYLLSENAEKF